MAGWNQGREYMLFDEANYTLRSYPDQIKYAGVVDFEGLYRMMIGWFKERKYDFYGTLYKDKPPELELEWTATRKIDEFYKHKIKTTFHLYDVKEVEAIKDGVKKKMIYCRIVITFEPTLMWDWQKKWKGNVFMDMLFRFYFKNVIFREWQMKWIDPLWYLYYSYFTKVKKYLGMEADFNAW